jgi:cytochrome P450
MAEAAQIYFNPWDEAYRANPYPYYAPLYRRPPQLLNLFIPMALVARYADVAAIMRDHERFSSTPPRSPFIEERLQIFGTAPRIVFSDPPVHTRLRRLVSKAFTPKRIKELEARIREITASLIAAAARKPEIDIMADLANPLPVTVIAEMLGVSPNDYPKFKEWSDTVVETDNVPPGMPLLERQKQTFRSLREYFVNAIEQRRREPGNDLISILVAASEDAETLSEEELIAFVIILLLAGNETTTNLIGNGMLALGRNRDQMELLRRDPSLMPRAIEEMLRYDCPVQSAARYPKVDMEIDGVTLKAQMPTFIIVAAANRDPEHFRAPERFDITRDPRGNLAFGEGIHYCLGAPLARMEGAIAIGAALERWPKLRLADSDAPFKYKGSYFLRGLAALPLTAG